MSDETRRMTVQEAGRLGGAAVKAKYGPEHFAACGRLGGSTTAQRHGPSHYQKIGQKGGGRMAELVRLGKAAEAAAEK